MATGTEEAEKVFRSAEERFLVGDIEGALRVTRKAKRHLASLPALQSALTAYEVHAAERSGGRNCWYAVLGVGVGGGHPEPVTHDHDAIKKRYRRLCLVLHPDKNRSAAADGAFKLLQRAWEVLSARHPPGTVPDPGPGSGPGPKPRPPQAGAPGTGTGPGPKPRPPQAGAPGTGPGPKPRPPQAGAAWAWDWFFGDSPPPGTADPDWWSSFFRDSPPAGGPGCDWWSSYFRYKPPPPERTWSSYGYTPPPPPFSSASSVNFYAWRSRYARKRGAYCGHCGSGPESAARGGHSGTPGGRCHSCGTPSGTAAEPPPPRQSPAEDASAPPPAAAGRR